MSTNSSVKRQPQYRATHRIVADIITNRAPVEVGIFRTSRDFSVEAYKQFDAKRSRAFGPFTNAVRALGGISAIFMQRLLAAMHESRRKQAAAEIARHSHLLDAKPAAQTSMPDTLKNTRESSTMCFRTEKSVDPAGDGMRIRCSITGAPCEGDLAHLCYDWGCARKGGLSSVSHENFW